MTAGIQISKHGSSRIIIPVMLLLASFMLGLKSVSKYTNWNFFKVTTKWV